MTTPTQQTYTTNGEYAPASQEFAASVFTDTKDWKYRVSLKAISGATVTAQGDDITQVVTDLAQLIQLANGLSAGNPPVQQTAPVTQPWNAQPASFQTVNGGAPTPVWAPPPAPGPQQQHGLPQAPQTPQWPGQAPAQQAQFGQQPAPGSLHPNALCQHGQPYIFRSGIAKNSGQPYQGYFCQQPKGQSCPPMK